MKICDAKLKGLSNDSQLQSTLVLSAWEHTVLFFCFGKMYYITGSGGH